MALQETTRVTPNLYFAFHCAFLLLSLVNFEFLKLPSVATAFKLKACSILLLTILILYDTYHPIPFFVIVYVLFAILLQLGPSSLISYLIGVLSIPFVRLELNHK